MSGNIRSTGFLGEGATRRAYSCKITGTVGEWKSPPNRWLGGLVFKIFKPEFYARGFRITDKDKEMQNEAARLVSKFSKQCKPTKNGEPCPVYMRTASLSVVKHEVRGASGSVICRAGDMILIEGKVGGVYEKFNSNTGWSCGNANSPDALSHWTWVESGGDMLVCDLQGQRGHPGVPGSHKMRGQTDKYWYLFTDPAICSRNQRFGITDLGQKGIDTWFFHHKCSDFCKMLGIAGRVPQARAHLARVRGSAYR